MTTEKSLSDTVAPQPETDPAAAADQAAHASHSAQHAGAEAEAEFVPPPPERQWTIAEILATARTPEEHARVSLRADLDAERLQIAAELATLINAQGEVIEDEDRPADQPSKAARAQELTDRDNALAAEQWKAMWFPLFRGLSSDDLVDFNKLHKPKGDTPKPEALAEYNTLLVAETSAASPHGPKLTVDDVLQLRKKLGARAMGALVRTAHKVCTQGGADVPKSPASSATRPPQ